MNNANNNTLEPKGMSQAEKQNHIWEDGMKLNF